MRQPKPYFKASHKAWYANIGSNKRPKRLASEAEGEAKAYERYYQIMADRQPVDSDTLVVELLDRFLDHHSKNSAPATYQFYARPVNLFARYIGPKLRLVDLKASHVYNWIDTLPPASDNYRRNQIRGVKAAFRWAEKRELIDRSPIRNVTMPPARPRDVYLMSEQWKKLIAEVSKSRDGGCLLDILTAMKETGCRPQEARRVEARHLDDKAWVFPAHESKGKREPRVVLLTDNVFAICQRLALKHLEGPLFRTSAGHPWTRRALSHRLYRLSKRLGFRACPYAIRHTFCTDAIERGVDLQTIATLMGHADLNMLSKVYQHIRKRSEHLRAGLKKAVGE
jgi:integrase